MLAKLPILIKLYNTYNLVFLDEFGRKRTQQIIFFDSNAILLQVYCIRIIFAPNFLFTRK